MNLPLKLGQEPLVEMVFEVRFRASGPVSNLLPGILFAQLDGEKKVTRLPLAELPQQIRANDPALRYAPILKVNWGTQFSILIGDRNLGLSCGIPYVGWDIFKPSILKILHLLAGLHVVEQVERFALKTVDLIEPQFGKVDEVINFGLTIGQHNLAQQLFHVRGEIDDADFRHILQVSAEGIAEWPDGKKKKGMVLDIDTVKILKKESRPSMNEFMTSLSSTLDQIHIANKKMFFQCLKQDALEKMEPVYA